MSKRLVREFKEVKAEGTYRYIPTDESLRSGIALVIGPTDVPYAGGYYFYKFEFPDDYPFSFPKCEFLTGGKHFRFHPNMYANGYICLSIFGGFVGSSWVPSMTLLTCLLTFSSLLSNSALTHEPGVRSKGPDVTQYDEIVRAANIDITMCEALLRPQAFMLPFLETMDEHFMFNYKAAKATCDKNAGKIFDGSCMYSNDFTANYPAITKKLAETLIVVTKRVNDRDKTAMAGAGAK
jgi:ubiquitin-protein ligase